MLAFEIVLLWTIGLKVEILCGNQQENVLFRLSGGDKYMRFSTKKIDWAFTISLSRGIRWEPVLERENGSSRRVQMKYGRTVLGMFILGFGKSFRSPRWLMNILNFSFIKPPIVKFEINQPKPSRIIKGVGGL